jgi:hypothetical protein
MRRSALFDWLATPAKPLSRLELWLGIITMYLVVTAYFLGLFARYAGTAEGTPIIPITNRA